MNKQTQELQETGKQKETDDKHMYRIMRDRWQVNKHILEKQVTGTPTEQSKKRQVTSQQICSRETYDRRS